MFCTICYRKLLPALFLLLLLLPIPSVAQLANQIMMVDLANRRYEGTTYFAEVWVIMMHDKQWPVCDAELWLHFDLNTLDGAAFDGPLFDFDPELANAGYMASQTYVGGPIQAIGISLFAPFDTYVTKQGGANGSSFRLGTVRWRAYTGGGMDGLFFGQSPPAKTTFSFHSSGAACELYDTPQRGLVNIREQVSLYIDPQGCTTSYYGKREGCTSDLTELDTEYPLSVIAPHWPATAGPGGPVHQVRYQYDFRSVDIPTEPLRLRGFNPNDISGLVDKARCRWEAQIDQLSPPVTNVFEWIPTTTGGRFYFTRDFTNFLPDDELAVGYILAETKTAFNPDVYWQIRDSSRCGYAPAWYSRSEIVFNNTNILYLTNPHLRWTTDLRICGDGPDCIDFYHLVLHEIGHYIGLAHQHYNHHHVMSKAEVWPKMNQLTLCDADNVRRLYNPARIGFPVDNSYDCAAVTGVPAWDEYPIQLLNVVDDGEDYFAVYSMPNTGSMELDICSITGQTLIPVIQGIQAAGEHTVHLPVHSLAAGVYFVRLQTESGVQSRKVLLVR